jgi:salicylate hydroxylase
MFLFFRLQPNGLRVLSLLPGFDIDKIPGQPIDQLCFRSWIPEEKATLAESDLPIRLQQIFGYPMIGVERAGFRRLVIQAAEDHGVEIQWEHSVVSLEQSTDGVRVVFEHRGCTDSDTASFVIGCDGLHSITRNSIFGSDKADFTGFTQVCCAFCVCPNYGSRLSGRLQVKAILLRRTRENQPSPTSTRMEQP